MGWPGLPPGPVLGGVEGPAMSRIKSLGRLELACRPYFVHACARSTVCQMKCIHIVGTCRTMLFLTRDPGKIPTWVVI